MSKHSHSESVTELLKRVASGDVSPEEAASRLRAQPFEELGFAKVDTHREVRQGVAEVIYGEGKTPEQIIAIARTLLNQGQEKVLITRLQVEKVSDVETGLQGCGRALVYDEMSRIMRIGAPAEPDGRGPILVVAAGTSDVPVALEAAQTAEFLGNEVITRFDVGVAGVHRLLTFQDDIFAAKAIIAVAGMEGALASVVGGLAHCPVIAVPTSVGYGASFQGLAALLAMLNSCASGVSVVNIDNGFGAGYQAHMINHSF